MTTRVAKWISMDEPVEVVSVVKENKYSYQDIRFLVKRADGNFVSIERIDILLQEEEAMISELASIFRKYNNPFRSERYKLIMRTLVKEHIPFGKQLMKLREQPNNQPILLEFG
jgi:hypothetical protein